MTVNMKLLDSPFTNFDWSVLESPEFLEDAVREEIISPLLWALGYGVTLPNRIVRSKRLEHPFVAIGTTRHPISIIPDYVMYVGERAGWILDAKSPRESVTNPSHEAQAYSYVCHRDIRASWYAVCNGREFAAFNVSDMGPTPRVRFPLDQLDDHWGTIWEALSPESLLVQSGMPYDKDFGIHLLKLGFSRDVQLFFPVVSVPGIGRVGNSLYSIFATTTLEGQRYAATFDFDQSLIGQLKACLPESIGAQVDLCLTHFPAVLKIQGNLPLVTIGAQLSATILENDQEHYLPLEVLQFHPVP